MMLSVVPHYLHSSIYKHSILAVLLFEYIFKYHLRSFWKKVT